MYAHITGNKILHMPTVTFELCQQSNYPLQQQQQGYGSQQWPQDHTTTVFDNTPTRLGGQDPPTLQSQPPAYSTSIHRNSVAMY